MNKKYLKAMITPLTTTILLLAVFLSNISSVSAIEIPRENILWGAGYWPSLTNFNPIRMNDGMGWDTYLMYEPLFGTDVATGQLIKWLGESIQWEDDGTTVHVTLNDGIYWVKIADWTGWVAETYTPVKYRNITTEDVNYTYFLTGAFPDSPPAAYWMDGLAARVNETVYKGGFEIVNDREFKVHINSTYAYSSVVWRIMTRGFLIVPKDVWMDINATTGDYLAFTNNWLDPGFNPAWRVASGMYLPWYRNPELTQTILKKNDNWWGKTVWGKEPAPKYMGYLTGIPNDQIIAYVKNGFLDWDGSYIPAIWDKTVFPYSNTYFKNLPYFPDKSALLMVPNNRKWPISEPWLHWALALVMDYLANSVASSGYCVNGSKYSAYGTQIQYPNAFLIPKDDAIANELLINYPRKDNYSIQRNVTKALAILDEQCYKKGGVWYTDDGPSIAWAQNLNNYYGDIDLTVGKVTHKASYWIANGFAEADEDAATTGVNVALGPWTLIDIIGWTDVCAIDGMVAGTVTTDLGITLTTNFLSWGGYTTAMDQNTYDFADYCMHWGINGDLYERYMQLFTGTYSGCWNHYGSYVNTQLEDLIESLDTVEDKQAVANQIFDIVGTDLPIIPMSGHPDWYIYSDKYWTGWPNEDKPFLPASPYGGASQEANLLYMLLGLKPHVTVEFSNLGVSKANVVPGENTTISVDVRNTQNIGGVATIKLLINGTVVDTKEVTFAAGETKTVSFNVSRQALGTYLAAIGGLTASFIVVEAPVVPAYIRGNVTDESTGNPISGASVVAGAYTTTTATNGSYLLEVVTGTYTLTIIMDGYKTGTATVNALIEGTTYTADIALTPLPAAEVMPIWGYGVIALFVIVAVVALAYAFVFKKK